MLIDSHCHLNLSLFKKKLKLVLNNAQKAKVIKIIVPGIDFETSKKALALAQQYPFIYAAIGIHPSLADKVKETKSEFSKKLKKLCQNAKVVALGECGLDYSFPFKKKSFILKKQKDIFSWQISLAKKLKLPLIIHQRQAEIDLLNILNSNYPFSSFPSLFHCFSGQKEILNWGLKHHFYFGIAGNITYNQKLAKAVKKIPLNQLLLETDSPYLLPPSLKKEQKNCLNEPKNVRIIAQTLAKIKGVSFLKICRQTTKNSLSFFKFKKNVN